MCVTKIKIATTLTLVSLTCAGVCSTGYSLSRAGQSAPIQAAQPKDEDAKKTDKMFPDGLVHDFGKVKHGTLVRHDFRIVNTSNGPLHITSLRAS